MSAWEGRRYSGRRGAYTRLAATLLVTTALSTSSIMLFASIDPAMAQTAQRARSFNITPQPLASALRQFADQSGMQLAYRTAELRGINSPGFQGSAPSTQALARLLAGTGISYNVSGANTVTIQRPTATADGGALPPGAIPLDTIDVQGANPNSTMRPMPAYAGGQVATGGQVGLLGNRNVMDTPFNQTSYTQKTIQDQQAKTIREVLINDPSVLNYGQGGGALDEKIRIRGFQQQLYGGASYGGLAGVLPPYGAMAELAERVEVLKGSSAMLNGIPGGVGTNGTGGTINVVPKRAPDTPLRQITGNYGGGSQFGGHVDIGQRFGADKQFGVRFNGVHRDGETVLDGHTDRSTLGVLGLDYRGESVRLAADLGIQRQRIDGLVPTLRLGTNVPVIDAPDASKSRAQPWDYLTRESKFGALRGEVDLNDHITAFAAVGLNDLRERTRDGTNSITINNTNGNGTGLPFFRNLDNQFRSTEIGLRSRFNTGPIRHELAIVRTSLDQDQDIAQVTGTAFATNIFNPTITRPANITIPDGALRIESRLSGYAIADTLSFLDDRIQLTIGAREQQVETRTFAPVTGIQTSGYKARALSPSFALVVKPWQNVSLYGNYIEGLQPGTTVDTTFANAGEVFPPYKTEQYEAGVKVDWGRFTATASLFQIVRPSTISVPGTPLPTLALNGEQRNRGIELNIFGEPTDGIRLLGGVMLLDAVLTKTQGGLNDGLTAAGSPTVNFVMGGEWDTPFAKGLTLTGRVVHASSQYIDNTSPQRSIPAWTRFDVGARYSFRGPGDTPLTARLNIENVFDNNYWESASGAVGTLALGAPRTIRFSLSANF